MTANHYNVEQVNMTETVHHLRFPSFKQHVKGRSMWKGSNVYTTSEYWMMDDETGKFSQRRADMSEALLKCFDEILVNACDQYVRSVGTLPSEGGPVNLIEVKFNTDTGEITVSNNGQGFDVYKGHPDLPEDMYTVEGVITMERSGTNFEDLYNDAASDANAAGIAADRVTGGINGLGMKLIIIDSDKFTIETVDKPRNTYYRQDVLNSMEEICPPTVINISNPRSAEVKSLTPFQKKPHTTISFIPDYANLCRKTQNRKNPSWHKDPKNMEAFKKIIEFRTYQLSAFVNSIKYRYENEIRINYKNRCKVFFNGELIPVHGTENLAARMSACANTISCTIASDDNTVKFPWSITVGVIDQSESHRKLKTNNINILNGVHLIDGGSHINYLMQQILLYINDKTVSAFVRGTAAKKDASTRKLITDSRLRDMIFIVDCLQIPTPQFTGQSKTSVKLGTKDLNIFKKTYEIPQLFLENIWKAVKDEVSLILSEREIAEDAKSNTAKKRTKIRKYEKARKAGNSKFLNQLMLFVPEGDSACKPIRDIIASKKTPLSSEFCGTYNIQGVPPNALKHTKPPVMRNGKPIIIKDKTLNSNIAFNGLIAALGLDYNKQYYYGPADTPNSKLAPDERALRKRGDEEFKTLNYGCIVIATDQDLDGIGHICSLILVEFLCFWPELVKRGFVKRLATPLMRIYTNNKAGEVLRFYSDIELQEWVMENYNGMENLPPKYEVNYYKGLAGHTEEEVIQDIGMNIENNIYTFTIDDLTDYMLKLAYGSDAGPRKSFLHSPVEEEFDYDEYENQRVSCTQHFGIYTKSYQLDFAARKLKSAIDGFIPSQRKAFAGGRKASRGPKGNAKVKVYQLTGEVTKSFHYQHGDTSMNDTIIKMAQNFTGGSNIPIFMPISNGFGDRRNGRNETGSPRYIDTKLNKTITDAMFPVDDDWLLEYVYEDGEQAEPHNYVPVLPISILETSTTVAAGWNIECWGRDPFAVINSVKRLIKFNYGEPGSVVKPTSLIGKVWIPDKMTIDVCKFSPSVPQATEVCFGSYELNRDKNEVRITQLPLKVWSYQYKCMLEGIKPDAKGEPAPGGPKEYVKSVYDDTGNDVNDVVIKLVPGAFAEIEKQYGFDGVDPYEDYMELRKQMHCRLNMLTDQGYVREFPTYESVIEYWYPKRKELYIERLNRQTLLLECKIDYWKNVLRFILADASGEINIDRDFSAYQREELLNKAKYVRFNKSVLFNPQYLRVNVLREHIYEINATFKYIDDITIGQKSKSSIESLHEKIANMEAELEKLKDTTWKNLWLEEIDRVEEVITRGIETKWMFGTKQHVFKKAEPRKKK